MKSEQEFKKVLEGIENSIGPENLEKYFHISKERLLVESQFGENKLNIGIQINSDQAQVSFFAKDYHNYIELDPPTEEVEMLADHVLEIVLEYLKNGLIREDKFVDKKLVSSSLRIGGQKMTSEIKGFKLFGKRTIKATEYPSPLH